MLSGYVILVIQVIPRWGGLPGGYRCCQGYVILVILVISRWGGLPGGYRCCQGM